MVYLHVTPTMAHSTPSHPIKTTHTHKTHKTQAILAQTAIYRDHPETKGHCRLHRARHLRGHLILELLRHPLAVVPILGLGDEATSGAARCASFMFFAPSERPGVGSRSPRGTPEIQSKPVCRWRMAQGAQTIPSTSCSGESAGTSLL